MENQLTSETFLKVYSANAQSLFRSTEFVDIKGKEYLEKNEFSKTASEKIVQRKY